MSHLTSPSRRPALASPMHPTSAVSPPRRPALASPALGASPASPPRRPSAASIPDAIHTSDLPPFSFSSSHDVNQPHEMEGVAPSAMAAGAAQKTSNLLF